MVKIFFLMHQYLIAVGLKQLEQNAFQFHTILMKVQFNISFNYLTDWLFLVEVRVYIKIIKKKKATVL